MYRVSYHLIHFARALLAGVAVATLWVNLAPASYYDAMEWRLFPLPFPDWLVPAHARVTLISLTSEALMALVYFLLAKELWEANTLERGALHGRRGGLPLLATLGACLGAVLVWLAVSTLVETAEEARFGTGWALPIGADVMLCYLLGRRILGAGSPALHMLLLITIGADLAGLAVQGLAFPDQPLRLVWLLLPLSASVMVWWLAGRHAGSTRESDRQRALHLWPYALAGLVGGGGVLAAGLPGALGLLPVIPAIPHAERAFGLFAEAEEFLHDPLNRLAHLLVWPIVAVMFLFGLTHGGIDLAAFGPTTITTLAAFWIGKPLGLLAGVWLAARLLGIALPPGIGWPQFGRIALLIGIGFTGPALALESAVPGGAMAEAARMGLALSLLPAVVLAIRPFGRG
ncbi:Na+/H+ antiporter NhaA [Gemmobacter denitrificans]|uniref:Putative Na(+)/H(+) antiporter NhaA homolog n=1 Tax=Gemmobacter denitrificans TaxID=3123040 RepID=A0ABU8BQ60_9RHOB